MLRTIATRIAIVLLAEAAIIAVVAGITLLANGGIGAPMGHQATYATVAHTTPRCEEDQPCWDGTRMGNRQVGATVVDHEADGSPIVSCPEPSRVRDVHVNEVGVLVCQY